MAINILDEMKNDFLVYATEVNNNRSFCDARDGLKPGMRATLWDMFTNGHTSNKPHVKSAKVSGSTISRLWPHGDSSIYEVIVRMSQPWINNLCEIDFHGANGSLLGGPDAASSRYTECRLSTISEEGFFTNIKKDVVDMIDNFSEDEKWPLVFPALFPRLLINGASGIGYTIANDWLPHNLNEVTEKIKEYINTGKVSTDNIYPDFPIGCIIINKKDCKQIYETGRGSVILRGKTDIIGKYINITELPYQVYAEPFIQKIKDLVNAGTLSGIEDICNKSDDNGLLIEIECSNNPNIVLQKLYKLTDLQCTFSANQMALVDGIPQMLNLEQYIKVYVDHNLECLRREYKFDLNKAEAQKEIVDGLIRAISIIDDIIKTIKSSKSSEDAKNNLISKFAFTENQAKAIVDMRLGKLANLEIVELNKELSELIKIIDKCTKFLASDSSQKKEFIKRLDDFTTKYGWTRRTEVVDIDLEAEKQLTKATKAEEKYIMILTSDNKLKKVPADQFKVNKLSDKDIKYIEVGAKDRFVLVSKTGTMYKYEVKKLTSCSQNSSGILLDDEIINIFTGSETENYLIFVTQAGLIKKIEAQTVFGLTKLSGAPVMKTEDKDKIVFCDLANDEYKLTITDKKAKSIYIKDILTKGRTAGGSNYLLIKKGSKIASVQLTDK